MKQFGQEKNILSSANYANFKNYKQNWKRFDEETIRDANGFIMIENPQQFSKITDLWQNQNKKQNKNKKQKQKQKHKHKPKQKPQSSQKKSKRKVTRKKTSDKKKESADSQRTITNSEKQLSQNQSKVKFFQGFDQMNQHLKDCKADKTKTPVARPVSESRNKSKSQKNANCTRKGTKEKKKSRKKFKSDEREMQSQKKDLGSESRKRRKESVRNTDILKQNLENHQAKKIRVLNEQLYNKTKQFEQYSNKSKEVIKNCLLKNQEFERDKLKRFIKMEKERLGEFMIHRNMTKTKEVWIDGLVMKEVKSKLVELRNFKEQREKFKKAVKRKKAGKVSAEEIITGELIPNKHSKPFYSILA